MTKITKVQPHIFEYIYASQFRVTIPCREHLPIMSRLSIEWLPESKTKYKDGLPGLRNFFLFAAKEYIVSHQNLTTRQVRRTMFPCTVTGSCVHLDCPTPLRLLVILWAATEAARVPQGSLSHRARILQGWKSTSRLHRHCFCALPALESESGSHIQFPSRSVRVMAASV